MAIKPLPTDQHAFVGTDGKPSTIFYTWLKQFADVALAFFNASGPAWTAYTPTVSSGTGTITAYTATGRSYQVGKIVFVQVEVDITTNGTGGDAVIVNLPVMPAAFAYAVPGRELVNNLMLSAEISPSTITANVRRYDGTYPGFGGAKIVLTGTYEAA